MAETYVVGVVGNPNCGKTTLFNALTGAKQRVGNWPGVTVERKIGRFSFQGVDIEVVDLPGTYSLDVVDGDVSLDEQIARDYVAQHEADLIINIVDASNIERNLYLTSQLLEMKVPMIVALNMMDVAKERGCEINEKILADNIGCRTVPIVAASGKGVEELKSTMLESLRRQTIPQTQIAYPSPIEKAMERLLPELASVGERTLVDLRWLAVRLLEGDSLAKKLANNFDMEKLKALQQSTEEALGDEIDICLADARYGFVHEVTHNCVHKVTQLTRTTSDKIDRVVLNRALGIPIFLLVMYLMFMFTINIGGAFIDFFDQLSGAFFVDGLGELLTFMGFPEWLVLLLAGGVGGGLQVVATFIPVIAFLYLFLSALEDSGYMARAAFVMDRAMRAIGLPGKAFVPLIVGFGCNVPAIMATRTMEHHRDRIKTILMAPFMSCGARLPVYALFAAAFFPTGGQNVVFGLYLIGIAVAVLTGFIMKNTLLPGQTTPFVMELPPYHVPTLKGVTLRTWDRTKGFMSKAGTIIVPMVLVLNVLNSIGTDGTYGNENSSNSVLSEIGRTIAPAFSPMGLDKENWPAAVGIFTGVMAKEAVVGTLDSLYSSMAEREALKADLGGSADGQEEKQAFSLAVAISEAFATIPANLSDSIGAWLDPLGLNIGDVSDSDIAAQDQQVTTNTFGAMRHRFDGAAGAFAYMLFILLYLPCVAAMAAIIRESSVGWSMFVAAWTTGLAYSVATVFYQAATYSRHPSSSLTWIVGIVLLFSIVMAVLRYWGQNQLATVSLAAEQPT